jgi:TetR/AcrR family transcriptional regulator
MEATQAAVLDSAVRCFGRLGYKKTSMDDVAADAGVAKGTVYLYCDSKQDLFGRAVENELHEWVDAMSSMIDPDRPADEIITDMARSDLAFVEERPLVADLLVGALDGQLPGYREKFVELRRTGVSHIVAVLRLGIEQGIFDADLDVVATARVLQEMQLAGALLSRRTPMSTAEVRRHQRTTLQLALNGLRRR